MNEILSKFLYGSEQEALEELREFSMKDRNDMASKAQRFADWLALENSREIAP